MIGNSLLPVQLSSKKPPQYRMQTITLKIQKRIWRYMQEPSSPVIIWRSCNKGTMTYAFRCKPLRWCLSIYMKFYLFIRARFFWVILLMYLRFKFKYYSNMSVIQQKYTITCAHRDAQNMADTHISSIFSLRECIYLHAYICLNAQIFHRRQRPKSFATYCQLSRLTKMG